MEVEAGTTIIQQGDTDAKTFYVLGLGTCEVLLQKAEWGNEPRSVLTYDSGRYPELLISGKTRQKTGKLFL